MTMHRLLEVNEARTFKATAARSPNPQLLEDWAKEHPLNPGFVRYEIEEEPPYEED